MEVSKEIVDIMIHNNIIRESINIGIIIYIIFVIICGLIIINKRTNGK